jgi:YHS domain-containing protein
MLMFHENAFLQYFRESSARGGDQAGSINWVMAMAQRNAGQGRVSLRGMFSAEPWTIPGCAYPDLLQSGEQCEGASIHDRQHPHDLVMEAAVEYDAPIDDGLRWQAYVGVAGEPALGPVAFPHRLSAMPNPLAPISHHWLDSTHVSFGVVTGGVYAARWKAEASVFNGREPDEHRTNLDLAPLDSFSGRLWFLPTSRLALQVSAGHLAEAEHGEASAPGGDVDRVTASATYHRMCGTGSLSATTVAWGRNVEEGRATDALLAETNLTIAQRHAWFGRVEVSGKTADELVVAAPPDAFTVAKLEAGYTRYLAPWRGFQPGIGGEVSLGVVPASLAGAYGGRTNAGFGIFLTIRPAQMTMEMHDRAAAPESGHAMIMVQTAYDPSRLMCTGPFDPGNAPRAEYKGKTYYFCTAQDRDDFLKDPEMSLSMRPPRE